MGKKVCLLVAFLSIFVASLYADSFRFSIVWEYTKESLIELSVVECANDEPLSTKALQQTTATQDVARIKYHTDEAGIHTLAYKATPLQNDDDPNGYRFSIFFKYPASNPSATATINVGNNKAITYPTGSLANTAYTNLSMGESDEGDTQYVAIQVQITDLNIMRQDTQYSSTIYIERRTQ